MAFDILAEGVGEPPQTPDLHTHGEVLPLRVRRADLAVLGFPLITTGTASTISAGE